MAETEVAPHTNGIDTIAEEEECNKTRPADIEADMREMERRKRVEAIMNSRLFREELERIVDGQMREGGSSNILQQLSDIMGMPAARIGSVFKSSNCVVPINDIRGMEAMGYEKGEKILRCKLAATFRLMDLYGWAQGIGSHITARLNADQELFLVNPFGVLNHEITASSLNKVNMQGQIVEQGTTNFGNNTSQFTLHSVIHAARPDIRCAIYVSCNSVVAISALKQGLLPLTKESALLGELSVHTYTGALYEPEEKDKLLRSLGPVSKVLLLSNHGAICCGETVEEAFYAVTHVVSACEAQLKLLPVGLDNLIVIPEETRKAIYDASRKPPEGFSSVSADNRERSQVPKWRVGGAEFEALMRMLDNAGFRTGYIYRNPLVKNDLPKPKNDVEVPPAVSSLGYLIEEEELFRQGIWKKGEFRKGGDRSRWLNSPNVYQKVEVLETGTPDPKKITKWIDANVEEWVAEASPTHSSTPVKIDGALQFVPPNTNPKEFKRLQQQIKDYRRADKISAGPQSHILEGVSWDEANRLKDANVSATGDHVVLMGAASKGIIQRGYQHNATVYKAPYAKNPFDSVTDDELNEYKKTVEKKRQGDYTDTDFSESEALSSLQISEKVKNQPTSPPSQSEPEDTATDHQVLRIETKQVPKPSQPEVVLSDALEADREDFASVAEDFIYAQFSRGLDQSESSLGTSRMPLFNVSSGSENYGFSLLYPNRDNRVPSKKGGDSLPYFTHKHRMSTSTVGQSCIYFIKDSAFCPYRTTAFFGFRSPANMPSVAHFHVPTMPSRYLRRSRSTSLNDVFATERYLSMSNNSLKRTVRKKLSFEQMQQHRTVSNFYRDLEIDFEYLEEVDHNNNLERISEVCDAHLRDMQYTDSGYMCSFLDKLGNMQYSKPPTPESLCVSENATFDSDNSLMNRTRDLFSDEASLYKLDLIDLKILKKIDNHSRLYGSLPALYHKIGEEILGRKNYEAIATQSPMVTCATQTDYVDDSEDLFVDFNHYQNVETQTCSLGSDSPQQTFQTSLNKTLKNRRNRNFVRENIERVKAKQSFSNRSTKGNQGLDVSSRKPSIQTSARKTPATVKQRRFRKYSMKRRSLQFTTDEEEEETHFGTRRTNQCLLKSAEQKSYTNQVSDQQNECIIEMGYTLSQIHNDVIEIVQLQDEIDATRTNHVDMISQATFADCRRVNETTSELTHGDN